MPRAEQVGCVVRADGPLASPTTKERAPDVGALFYYAPLVLLRLILLYRDPLARTPYVLDRDLMIVWLAIGYGAT